MKKVVILIFIIVAILSTIGYIYYNYLNDYNLAQRENIKFEIYKDENIEGSQLTSLINKAVDSKTKNSNGKGAP